MPYYQPSSPELGVSVVPRSKLSGFERTNGSLGVPLIRARAFVGVPLGHPENVDGRATWRVELRGLRAQRRVTAPETWGGASVSELVLNADMQDELRRPGDEGPQRLAGAGGIPSRVSPEPGSGKLRASGCLVVSSSCRRVSSPRPFRTVRFATGEVTLCRPPYPPSIGRHSHPPPVGGTHPFLALGGPSA